MIVIDYSDRRPIYEQITERLRQLIIRGVLPPGEQLPSVRTLAAQLSINPNTIQRAYQELEYSGFICSVKGKGSFVSPDLNCLEEQRRSVLAQLKTCISQALELSIPPEELLAAIHRLIKEETAHD